MLTDDVDVVEGSLVRVGGKRAQWRSVNCVPHVRGSPGCPVNAGSGRLLVEVRYRWLAMFRTNTESSHRR
jgi:hypothetical protein